MKSALFIPLIYCITGNLINFSNGEDIKNHQTIARSMWYMPLSVQMETTFEFEYNYCAIIMEFDHLIDKIYVKSCRKWMNNRFNGMQIMPEDRVQRSFWEIPKSFQKETRIDMEHNYCLLVLGQQWMKCIFLLVMNG